MTASALMDALRDLYQRKDGSLEEFNAEAQVLNEALDLISTKLKDTYELLAPVGRGGAGVVIKLQDKQVRALRALKLPRPRKGELIESVHNEIDHLTSLAHDNLVRVYAAGEVRVSSLEAPYPYFVMEFVDNPMDLEEALTQRLEQAASASDLPSVTDWLASQMSTVSRALRFLHLNQTLHFDVKPPNVLVDHTGKTIVTDLGFAKRMTTDKTPVVVGFTLFYAHPTLRTAYEHMSSQNRVRRKVAPIEFTVSWDVYALGRTLLQLLAQIDARFPYAVMYDYTFVYLHLLACRMLDGRNLPKDETSRIRSEQANKGKIPSMYLEHWLTLQAEDLAEIKYSTMEQVCDDLEKLVNQDYYLAAVPELSAHYPHRVQVASTAPAPFSNRTKALVEHPVFLRLRSVKQLGIGDAVYPGCTHTRAEHSLGSFRMCWLYLQALLHDAYNPLFRQIASTDDLKCILVASLLHDLGQYPLAHDLEDVAASGLKDLFRHERLTEQWLDNMTADSRGRTIRQILEAADGWAIRIDYLRELLYPADDLALPLDRHGLVLKLLRSIIDGPIDVDKLDYLVRDSKRADLPYGMFLDVDRLVRSLTVVLTKDDHGRTLLTLGAYEKGQSAAESVTFARYELYQALYWHHAIRAIRPMLREVLRSGAFDRSKGKSKTSFEEAFEQLLGLRSVPREIGVEDILTTLEKYASSHGVELLTMVRKRRFYKRLLTIHSYPEEEGMPPLLQRFRDVHRNPAFDAGLQEEIRRRFDDYRTGVSGPQPSTLANERVDPVLDELAKPGRILSDCPPPRAGSHEKLRFALEPKRRLQNYASRVEVGERVSEVWQQVSFRLMEIASKGRVYCHPEIRDALMAALGPEGIRTAVRKMVAKFER